MLAVSTISIASQLLAMGRLAVQSDLIDLPPLPQA
jgi:hypothetical protein